VRQYHKARGSSAVRGDVLTSQEREKVIRLNRGLLFFKAFGPPILRPIFDPNPSLLEPGVYEKDSIRAPRIDPFPSPFGIEGRPKKFAQQTKAGL
jgi:hypothetical protein